MRGLAAKAEGDGVRILTGVTVTGFVAATAAGAVTAVETDRARSRCDDVVVGVGPWIKRSGTCSTCRRRSASRAATARCTTTCRCGHYWRLQEGTLGVDPELQKTNDGKMPPVIHVDTDAPLHSDVDGSLITDKLWGLYYKPDFHFGGVQGGAMPYKVERRADEVAVDPYGPNRRSSSSATTSPTCGARRSRSARSASRASIAQVPEGAVGRHRLLHAGQLPGVRPLPRERLRDRRLQPRLQDARRRRAGRRGAHGRAEPRCWSRSGSRATPRASCTRSPTARSRGAETGRGEARKIVRGSRMATLPVDAYVEAPGRDKLVRRSATRSTRSASPTSTTSSSRSPAASSARASRPTTGSARPRRASSSSTARPPTCSSTGTASTSATARRPRS